MVRPREAITATDATADVRKEYREALGNERVGARQVEGVVPGKRRPSMNVHDETAVGAGARHRFVRHKQDSLNLLTTSSLPGNVMDSERRGLPSPYSLPGPPRFARPVIHRGFGHHQLARATGDGEVALGGNGERWVPWGTQDATALLVPLVPPARLEDAPGRALAPPTRV